MRLFYAIDIENKEVKNKILGIINRLKPYVNCKWVEEYNLHITLKFLGEVKPEKLNYLKQILEEFNYKPFEIELKNLGLFNNRVIWVGINDNGKLKEIFDYLDSKTKSIRIEEKEYKPHLTIGRIKYVINYEKFYEIINKKYNFGKLMVNKIKLKKSTLTPHGPIYEDIYVKNL